MTLLILVFSSFASADSIDVSGSLGGMYSIGADVLISDPSELALILDAGLSSKANHLLLGLGYRASYFTPWVAMYGETINKAQGPKGVSFGINGEYWQDRMGVSGTLAKVPEGFLAKGLLKYNVSGIGTAHLGYIYRGEDRHGLVFGLGLAY